MNMRNTDNLSLSEAAADWVTRRRKDRSPECNAAFLKWLKDSPRHMDEYLAIEVTYAALRRSPAARRLDIEALVTQCSQSNVVALDGAPPVKQSVAMTEESRPSPPMRVARPAVFRRRAGIAAAVAASVTGVAWGWWYFTANTYETDVGEQRMMRLADGSVLHLNTGSRVKVTFTREARELRLVSGEAFFTVAQDSARPFQVRTEDAVVQAVGTQFNVYRHGLKTQIAVLEGRVRVTARGNESSRAPGPVLLDAGQQADVAHTGEIARDTTPVDASVAWRERRLIFWAVPLAEVAAQFNRYNDEYRISIEDKTLAQRKIWAVFRVDEPQGLVKFLAGDPGVKVEKVRNGLVVRRR